MAEDKNTAVAAFVNAVIKYFSTELIVDAMTAKIEQFNKNSIDTKLTVSEETILQEWEKFCKDSALRLVYELRNYKQMELNKGIEDYIKEIVPEETFK